jgi:hypothetical protein
LNEAGGAKVALGYQIDDGVVTVSTKDDLESAKYQVIRVFDIRDMLVTPMEGTLALPKSGERGKGRTKEETEKGNAAMVQGVIDTIETVVAPGSWREKGGKVGSIRELNGQLIVSQTEENAAAVRTLIG